MHTPMAKTFTLRYQLPVFITGAALLISGAIILNAQLAIAKDDAPAGAAVSGITFPIPELGNCAGRDECRAYCNETSHMDTCVAFAQAHGLMNKEEASHAEKFKAQLQAGRGPGGCASPKDCEVYCGDTAHLEVCVQFAKDQGVKDANTEQGEKVLAYIKSGGRMPGDCTSRESCLAYCGDFSHAEECATFAKDAGITQSGGNGGHGNNATPAQIKKLAELAQNGQTPGGCKSKDECEAYCQDEAHRDECIAFGVKAGFIKPGEADMIKKSGGTGPGRCDSPDACRAYCNDQAHRDECYKFAEDHGFISHDQAAQAQQGLTRVRAGFDQAPPEVIECLKSSVGPNVIDDMQSGKLVPTSEIGQSIKSCFEKFGAKGDSAEPFKNAPPRILACLKDKIGADQFAQIRSGKTMPTPEMADTVRVCFQTAQFQGESGHSDGNINGGKGGMGEPPSHMLQNFLRTAPPDMLSCLKDKLGDDFDKIQNGGGVQADTSKLKSCFEQFHPAQPGSRGPDQEKEMRQNTEKMRGSPGNGQINKMLPQELDCIKEKLGDNFSKIQSGESKPTPDMDQQMKNCLESPRAQSSGGFVKPSADQDQQFTPGEQPPFGEHLRQPTPPPDNTPCPSGQYWNGSACMPPPTTQPPPVSTPPPATTTPPPPDPATECANKGGSWGGSTCVFPKP